MEVGEGMGEEAVANAAQEDWPNSLKARALLQEARALCECPAAPEAEAVVQLVGSMLALIAAFRAGQQAASRRLASALCALQAAVRAAHEHGLGDARAAGGYGVAEDDHAAHEHEHGLGDAAAGGGGGGERAARQQLEGMWQHEVRRCRSEASKRRRIGKMTHSFKMDRVTAAIMGNIAATGDRGELRVLVGAAQLLMGDLTRMRVQGNLRSAEARAEAMEVGSQSRAHPLAPPPH